MFEFKAGQYVIIRLNDLIGDKRGSTRPFSISSSPQEALHTISITTMIEPDDSPFKRRLDSLQEGDVVTLLGPSGRFVISSDLRDDREIVMVAGGIGITPFRSMIKAANADPRFNRKLRLLYSARSEENLIFKKEFDQLQRENQNFSVHYTLTRPRSPEEAGHIGRIDTQMIRGVVPDAGNAAYYVCGPSLMVSEIASKLTSDLSVASESIKTEKFIGY